MLKVRRCGAIATGEDVTAETPVKVIGRCEARIVMKGYLGR